ncbi:MAG: NUDIX hydrolase [Opitutales bacterium]
MTGGQSQDEKFDVVDEHDAVVGVETRGVVHARNLRHRACHVFWLRRDGMVCLQRRSYAKDSSPGLLSSSCAGHVDSGESYLQAAVREFREELGIGAPAEAFKEIDYAPCHPELGNEFVRTYLIRGDWRAAPSGYEVDSVLWRSPEELFAWTTWDRDAFATPLHHLLARPGVREAFGHKG